MAAIGMYFRIKACSMTKPTQFQIGYSTQRAPNAVDFDAYNSHTQAILTVRKGSHYDAYWHTSFLFLNHVGDHIRS